MSNICSFHVRGKCSKGSTCQFSHDTKGSQPHNVCRFFLSGHCAYGKACRFDHVKQPRPKVSKGSSAKRSSLDAEKSMVPLTIAKRPVSIGPFSCVDSDGTQGGKTDAMGANKDRSSGGGMVVLDKKLWHRGKPQKVQPEWAHSAAEFVPADAKGDQEVESGRGKFVAPAHDPATMNWIQTTTANIDEDAIALVLYSNFDEWSPFGDVATSRDVLEHEAAAQRRATEKVLIEQSAGVECCICLEEVTGKYTYTERRFGILPGCSHAFCLSCIRHWRSSTETGASSGNAAETVRTCPICRALSYYVVPSKFWVADPEQKARVLEAFRQKTSAIHCQHFARGKGTCPFGTSCFYKHEDMDGRTHTHVPRFRADASGALAPMPTVYLSHFLEAREDRHIQPNNDDEAFPALGSE
eukprot:m.904352 g.904352  ORF g.904352 m.904352 type:complete len:411 (-) comp23695_c0_seq20:2190-3422(-)